MEERFAKPARDVEPTRKDMLVGGQVISERLVKLTEYLFPEIVDTAWHRPGRL